MNKIINKDCLEALKELPDNSIDSIVTDPPYGLSFMGKKWDYDVPSVEIWSECLRVLKPGGYLLAFAGTRTQHRMAVRIEDAGFEIRDMIAWIYGSGFPKSRNIGLDVDKRNGVTKNRGKAFVVAGQSGQRDKDTGGDLVPGSNTMGAYIAQNEWSGWGTALKPSLEPITIARKPISENTVAENCLKWGVGGINIDGSRVGVEKEDLEAMQKKNDSFKRANNKEYNGIQFVNKDRNLEANSLGRFPANLIHDGSEEVLELFPESKSSNAVRRNKKTNGEGDIYGNQYWKAVDSFGFNDSGSAARFFYCAKASKSERNMGCEHLPLQKNTWGEDSDGKVNRDFIERQPRQNNHPTVKPIKLMEYLVNLVSKEGHTVLDPFAGSGTTGIACKKLNRNFIGIERDEEYCKIANARIESLSQNNTLFV